MHLRKREVLVDEAHLVLVALQSRRKQRFVHLRAVGALEVVEVDHRHLGCGVSAHRSARNIDVEGWILRQIEGLEPRQRLAVRRNQKVERRCLRAARKTHGKRIIARKRARPARPDRHHVILRHVELRADQHLDTPIYFEVRSIALLGWLSLAAHRETECEQAG